MSSWRKSRKAREILEEDFVEEEKVEETPKLFDLEPVKQFFSRILTPPERPKEDTDANNRMSVNSSVGPEYIDAGRTKPTVFQALVYSPYFKPTLVLLVLGTLGAVGFVVYDMLRVPEYACPGPGGALEVEVGRKVLVGPSESGSLCALQGATVLGRSYDGFQWEESAVARERFSCGSDGKCTVFVPGDLGPFKLVSYPTVIQNKTDKEVARFLMQASFGPTKAELDAWGTKTFVQWIQEQIDLPPTSHREYFRKRVSPRVASQTLPGRPRGACESLSRWHRFAFTQKDIGKSIVVTLVSPQVNEITLTVNGTNGTNATFIVVNETIPSVNETLDIDGVPRVELRVGEFAVSGTGPFLICDVQEFVGGDVTFADGDCSGTTQFNPNPAIEFAAPPGSRLLELPPTATLTELAAPVDGVRVLDLGSDTQVENCTIPGFGPIFVVNPADGLYYQHDSRLVLVENTLEAPAEEVEADGVYCVNAPKTFLNQETCVVGGRSCAPPRYSSVEFTLDDTNIRNFFTVGGHFIYRVEGLRLDDINSPCETTTSRWINVPCSGLIANPTIDTDTLNTLIGLLNGGTNPAVRDILVPDTATCVVGNTKGAMLNITDGTCWVHSHPELYNVYDFGFWTLLGTHPGNLEALNNGRVNPIKKWAESFGVPYLAFPGNHEMMRWRDNRDNFPLLGRFMDTVDFQTLPTSVQSARMADFYGASADISDDESFTERCGSPGEVANDPRLGARFTIGRVDDDDIRDTGPGSLDLELDHENFKTATWTMNALFAADQLRQRMAFALSQILVITEQQVESDETEVFLTYYDIFVRHALGNYKDVLTEVSFSPMMADMLTFLETKSFEYSLRTTGREVFPDENYAREIMQLFSIGLLKLNNDGTVQKDGNGVPLETYTNEDIIAFSRAWTGFTRQLSRGNFESVDDTETDNRIDPMRITPEFRDQFPKMDLYKGHIGDGYPLCVNLPPRMFLRKGAIFLYLGKNPLPTQIQDPSEFALGNDVKRMDLDPASSALYHALCQPDGSGSCRYQSRIELNETLQCDGLECDVDTVRVVNISNAFYEFVRPACAEFPFYNNGRKVSEDDTREAMCAHPGTIIASEACCDAGDDGASQTCVYDGELLSYATMTQRCADRGKVPCDFRSSVDTSCYDGGYHWSSGDCFVRLKVSTDQGKIALVHEPSPGPSGGSTKSNMREHVDEHNRNWFRVNWAGNSFPSPDNGCKGICTLFQGNECLCNVTVSEAAVFAAMPTRAQVIERLRVGSVAPDVFDDGVYTLIGASTAEVEAYTHSGGSPFDAQTMFKVTVQGDVRYFLNVESTVSLSNGDRFRNPANLMNLVEGTVRDAMYETDAVIDHFFRHPNCAPFLAYRFIQRFVSSNPSPRYVNAVATAFAEGVHEGIGSGKYGDLAAMITAVLLDREARNTLLDADPTHGQLREPLLKVIHMLRSMETNPRGSREVELDDLEDTIGEMAHLAPDVFSFFKPEYSPPGPLATAGLTGPEAQVFTGPKVIAALNGLISLARFGVTDCFGGFGNHYESHSCGRMRNGQDDPKLFAPANLDWTPAGSTPEEVVDELSLLLTAGRIDVMARDIIVEEYSLEEAANGQESAIKVAQQLLIGAPEFHASNYVRRAIGKERTSAVARNGTRPFKAIVYLFMFGGLDSFNLIIPHSQCRGGKDMYAEYVNVRTDIALPLASILPIGVPSGAQVCNTFALHPNLPRLKQLYDQRDALFMANIGPLVEPVTKEEFQRRTKELPESLFSHNIQQQSTQTMSPQERIASGVIGRMNDALYAQGFSTGAFSISGINFALEGEPAQSPAQDFIGGGGVNEFNPSQSFGRVTDAIGLLNRDAAESFYGETWSATVDNSLSRTATLNEVLDTATLEQPWQANSGLGNQLQQVARLIKSREQLGTDRQTFFVTIGGFDTHSNVGSTLVNRFQQIDAAIASFEEEMKLQGMWNDVTLISASDFARTITSNGAGTDHGWGGNYFMVGGSVKGRTIIGEYPDDLTSGGPQNIGRGRLIPTTSWDAVWNGVATWFGVEQDRLSSVLPNRERFGSQLFNQNTLFGTHDPDSIFRNWATILGISITVTIFGLIFVVSMGRNSGGYVEPVKQEVGVPKEEEEEAPRRPWIPLWWGTGAGKEKPPAKLWEFDESPKDDDEAPKRKPRRSRLPSI